MKGAKPLPSLAAKVFDIPQARLRQVSQLLADEYPKLVAAGVNSFAAVHHHLIEDPAIEAYLDSMSPEVVARIIRKAKAALVEGCWVTEGHVKEYLRIWMADTVSGNGVSPGNGQRWLTSDAAPRSSLRSGRRALESLFTPKTPIPDPDQRVESHDTRPAGYVE